MGGVSQKQISVERSADAAAGTARRAGGFNDLGQQHVALARPTGISGQGGGCTCGGGREALPLVTCAVATTGHTHTHLPQRPG